MEGPVSRCVTLEAPIGIEPMNSGFAGTRQAVSVLRGIAVMATNHRSQRLANSHVHHEFESVTALAMPRDSDR